MSQHGIFFFNTTTGNNCYRRVKIKCKEYFSYHFPCWPVGVFRSNHVVFKFPLTMYTAGNRGDKTSETERILDSNVWSLYRRIFQQQTTTSISNRLHRYVDQIAPITTWIQLLSDHRKWSPCLLCLPILGQILTRGSLRIMVKNVDPNYDGYRRQKSSIKSCFGHKYVYVCEVRCQIVALKSIFCSILRRPRLEMKRKLGPNLSARRTQSGGIPTDSVTRLCQLMFTTALKIAAGFPIHVGNRTR